MNGDRDFERNAGEWLNAGSDWTPPHVIEAVLLAVRTTPQDRDLRMSWRSLSRRPAVLMATVIALLAVAGVASFYALGSGDRIGSVPTPSPTLQPTQAPTPTATPSSSALVDSRFLPAGWTMFHSDRYGFSIGHPADWTVVPADHDWTFEADANNRLSTGQEVFVPPAGDIRVSAWLVALKPDAISNGTPDGWPEVETWAAQYCQQTSDSPCTGIHDRAVQMCNERYDCHPALLVPFANDVQAFFTGGNFGDRMVVVAVWSGESAPAVVPYGGSRQLLETFLMTMEVCPAHTDQSPWGVCPQAIPTPSP